MEAKKHGIEERIEQLEEKSSREKYILEHKSELSKTLMLTNGFNFEGYDIINYINIISGEVVIGTGFLSELDAVLSDTIGGKSSFFSEKMQEAKESAIKIMKEKAVLVEANAIIGVSFEFISFSSNMIGVSVNGTAVKIQKKI